MSKESTRNTRGLAKVGGESWTCLKCAKVFVALTEAGFMAWLTVALRPSREWLQCHEGVTDKTRKQVEIDIDHEQQECIGKMHAGTREEG